MYNSSQILCEYEGFRLARKYVYGPGIDEPVRMTILPNTDLNGDSSTDLQDIYVMSTSWMRHSGDPAYNHTADLNSDGVVDNLDADILAGNWRAVNAAGRHYYYHFDGLGSVIALTDSSGKTVEIYRYSAFGQTTIYNAQNHPIAASQVGNIYYFTGRQLDTETGLYYYRARMYSPALGRFMQTDPIGYADGMNWYAYCGNNPIMLRDPSGLCGRQDYTGNPLIDYASAYWKGRGTVGQALIDGIAIFNGNVTFGLWDSYLESQGYQTSADAIQRQGGAGEYSQYAAYVSGGALAPAIGMEILGVDVMLWGGGTAAASNPEMIRNITGSTTTLYHGGNLTGGVINPSSFSTTPSLSHAQQYAGNAINGIVYQFNVPNQVLQGFQVETYMDSYMGGPAALEYRFYGQAASDLMNYMVPLINN